MVGFDLRMAQDTGFMDSAAPPEGDGGQADESPYAIPPVIWILVFLALGYVLIRLVMED